MKTRFASAIRKTSAIVWIVMFSTTLTSINATTHVIKFGGSVGFNYSPNSLNVSVGDTVEWVGDFSQHPLSSTSVPAGALSFNEGSGSVFLYPVTIAGTYQYQCDFHFSSGMTGSFNALATGIENANTSYQDLNFSLEQNFPNPFNPSTIINYTLLKAGNIVLKIYDVTGKELEILDRGYKEAGKHSITFNAGNLASGVYLYQLVSGNLLQTKKLILLK